MKRILLGTIGVDSGSMMLVDPCYLSRFTRPEWNDASIEEMKKSKEFSFDYNGSAAATLGSHMGGVLEKGVAAVCRSGYGDGCYEVWIEVSDIGDGWGERVRKMEIIFD